ncbi:MAG: hypothetical protein JXA74_00210, partial [Anaerolineae bacterium]|nr:hypothetical protein [Anaerolineae bacterium]
MDAGFWFDGILTASRRRRPWAESSRKDQEDAKGKQQAEGVGFEPTVTTSATTVFETAPIGRS